MGFKESIKKGFNEAVKRILPSRSVQALTISQNELDKYPEMQTFYFNPGLGQPKEYSPSLLRKFGESVWVNMVTDTIIKEVIGLGFDIVPEEDEPLSNADEIKRNYIRDFFNKPNRDDNYYSFMNQYIEDILKLDGGVIVKIFSKSSFDEPRKYTYDYVSYEKGLKNPIIKKAFVSAKPLKSQGELLELQVADSGSFYIQKDIYGRLFDDRPTYFQYAYTRPAGKPKPFYKREVSYAMMNPRSYRVYGTSPIVSIIKVLEMLLNATSYNSNIFKSGLLPSFIVSLEDMPRDEIQAFQKEWKSQVKGKLGIKAAFVNKPIKFERLSPDSKDLEWLDGQKFYMKLVFAAYRVTQGELGYTDELNKHSSGVQSNINVRKAILPLVKLIEDKFNSDIIPELDIKLEGVSKRKFKFKIPIKDEFADYQKRVQEREDVKAGILTVNEVRKERGLEPKDGGDELKTPSLFQGGFGRVPIVRSKKKVELVKSLKLETEEDYAAFIGKYYEQIRKEVINNAGELKELAELYGVTKSWSNFWKRVLEITQIGSEFVKIVRRYIEKTFKKGIEQGEEQVGVQIGFRPEFNHYVDQLTDEQVNGYVLPDGKRWFGIKGLNEELQRKLRGEIREALVKGESLRDITERINKLFDGFSKNRSMMIARTESTRILNQGMNTAYIQSGIPGRKEWVATLDNRTCPICARLNGQKVGLSEAFIDPATGKGYWHPSAHPNCRCRIVFNPEEEK